MRIVTYGGAVSLDGFLTAADGSIDWLHFSQDAQRVMAEYWKGVDTILMGRKTYQAALEMSGGKSVKGGMGMPAMRAIVFSASLKEIDDPGIELISSGAVEFVRELKEQEGGGICLMGGGELAQSLLAAGLVDRIGLNIHPVLLGSGVPTFRDVGRRVSLKLTECRPMDGGCILALYDVVHAK